MKFTLSWLKEHLETAASLDEICETLTVIGLEVEGVDDPSKRFAAFVVGEVLEAKPHPDADKLQVLKVDNGQEVLQVVCGAPNARAGMKGAFAPAGTYVPGLDVTLKKAKIRGVESNGMMCSERELELSTEHTGIIDLQTQAKPGTPFAAAAGLDDPMIEIAITPNRPDALGVRGIARDLAAAGLGKLKPDPLKPVKGEGACEPRIELRFPADNARMCPVFAGRLVTGVKNGPSPDWLQRRLKAVGLRPINALVDVTNYISFDRGRPLHVYDADKLQGVIHARPGKAGESFLALDGETYQVDARMCVIADEGGVLGLGGIMGGETTGCTEATTSVFIESAYFDPITTATTGRALQLMSDARYRFERGVDPQFVVGGLELATRMILDLCGGRPSELEVAGEMPKRGLWIEFAAEERFERLIGKKVPARDIAAILKGLGFKVETKGKKLVAEVPEWRPDIHGPVDLIEEAVRIIGVDKVEPVPLPRLSGVSKPVLTERQARVRRARRVLAGRGMVEAVTWSFITRREAELFGGGAPALELANPISADLSNMRPGLLPGLLAAVKRNQARGFADSALFEVGQAYRGDAPEDQYIAASGVRAGSNGLSGGGRHWTAKARGVDLYDVKADVMDLLAQLGLDPAKLQVAREAPQWYHPGHAGVVKLGPKVVLAQFGEIHPAYLEKLDLTGPIAAFELFIDAVPPARRKATRTKPALELTDLQPVRRDFAFLVAHETAAGDVVKAALNADKELIEAVNVFDSFEGGSLPAGKRSLAIEVTLQPRRETLTDKDIEAVAERIVKAVAKATGGEIRG
jgi:phenylalanyl-tRNA synthetase beta chain